MTAVEVPDLCGATFVPSTPTSSSSAIYRHEQTTAAAVWTITHGRGLHMPPSVVVDTAGTELVFAPFVTTTTTTTITLPGATSGYALLIGA